MFEDELAELPIVRVPRADLDSDVDSEGSHGPDAEKDREIGIPLHFRGFEVKTVKLVLGDPKAKTGGLPRAR